MSGRRVSARELAAVAERLSDRDWAIIRDLLRARVLTGGQLERLHFVGLSEASRPVVRRRTLGRLASWRVITTLERRIGGVRGGSAGLVYALDVAGQRLAHLDEEPEQTARPRRPWTPSPLFLAHSLAVSELLVSLTEHSHTEGFELQTFVAEPACWWPDGLGGWLKPDAFAVLRTTAFDHLYWVEVDRGTASMPTVTRKLHAYLNFVQRGQTGPRGIVPRVLLSVKGSRRIEALRTQVGHLPAPAHELFAVAPDEQTAICMLALSGLPTGEAEKPP